MKAKTTKVYSLAQVGKLLGVAHSTIYNYINAGLIQVLPRTPGKKEGRKVTEAEFLRLKRDGVNPTGLKAKLSKRGAAGKKAAKKSAKRGVSAVAAKKRVKRKAVASAAKKLVKSAAPKTTAKKRAKRRGPAAKKGRA